MKAIAPIKAARSSHVTIRFPSRVVLGELRAAVADALEGRLQGRIVRLDAEGATIVALGLGQLSETLVSEAAALLPRHRMFSCSPLARLPTKEAPGPSGSALH